MHEGLERAVRQAVGRAVDELAGIARFGHECRAVGDLVDTRLQLHGLGHVLRADHVQDRGCALHDVGAAAAGVEDGVVDARIVGHMLAQKLHADVHELDRVQRAPAQLRRARRVGGDAVEGVLHLDAGVRAAGDDLVAVLRVPGERGVELLPEAVARHESLGCAALLAGAAVERDGAGAAGLLQPGLDADRGGPLGKLRHERVDGDRTVIRQAGKLPGPQREYRVVDLLLPRVHTGAVDAVGVGRAARHRLERGHAVERQLQPPGKALGAGHADAHARKAAGTGRDSDRTDILRQVFRHFRKRSAVRLAGVLGIFRKQQTVGQQRRTGGLGRGFKGKDLQSEALL